MVAHLSLWEIYQVILVYNIQFIWSEQSSLFYVSKADKFEKDFKGSSITKNLSYITSW